MVGIEFRSLTMGLNVLLPLMRIVNLAIEVIVVSDSGRGWAGSPPSHQNILRPSAQSGPPARPEILI